jgi:Flp pilus assembly protein TadD, contains TPR repeats
LPILQGLKASEPTNGRVLLDLAKALEKLNRDEEAIQYFQGALKLEPESAEAHYQLARVYQKLRRQVDFERELETAQNLQQKKLKRQESLLKASGVRGDPSGSAHMPSGDHSSADR